MIPEKIKQLGLAVAIERKRQQLSQQQLADLAGCGLTFVNQFESGKSSVRFDKVLTVLCALGFELKLQVGKRCLVSSE